jgi:hypothetical protein
MSEYRDVDLDADPCIRGPLRSVARYSCVVRRAMLDEATKNFVMSSLGRHLFHAEWLLSEQIRLETTRPKRGRAVGHRSRFGEAIIATSWSRPGEILALSKMGRSRYDISSFAGEVRKEEQPLLVDGRCRSRNAPLAGGGGWPGQS